jgi:hypothetical protein
MEQKIRVARTNIVSARRILDASFYSEQPRSVTQSVQCINLFEQQQTP